ncbi:MAG: hypothetical protein HY329_11095 [Chloroflexi bacterium]|nr:hypothetical protein [Chloroflexota bacterium]
MGAETTPAAAIPTSSALPAGGAVAGPSDEWVAISGGTALLGNEDGYLFSSITASFDCPVGFTPSDQSEHIGLLEMELENMEFIINDAGQILMDPPNLCEHSRLWNGRFETRFHVPWNAQVGELVEFTVTVTDLERDAVGRPFVSTFRLRAAPAVEDEPRPGGRSRPRGADSNGTGSGVALALPSIREVRKEEWDLVQPPFNQFDAIRIRHDGEGGHDFFVNVDNTFLLTELARAKGQEEKAVYKHWFKFGLVLAAVGMIRHSVRLATVGAASDSSDNCSVELVESDDLDSIGHHATGLAQTIIPIIRTLSRSPVVA